jgi:PTS system nitrogen regulatory IIA component
VKLSDIIPKEAIVPEIRADFRDTAILELLEAIERAGRLKPDHREEALLALLKREALSSTVLADSIAIPHAKVRFVQDFTGALGISEEGIDFGAADRRRVHVVLLFLSPEHAISGHLQLMAHIGGIARHPNFVRLLRSARGEKELQRLVADAEKLIFKSPGEPI